MQSCDYRGIVGYLICLALTTRPHISQPANILSSFAKRVQNTAKACVCYLKGTKSEKLIYRK